MNDGVFTLDIFLIYHDYDFKAEDLSGPCGITCGQSYESFTIVNFNTRDELTTYKIEICTTLGSQITNIGT